MPTAVPIESGEVDGLTRRSFVLCHDLTTLSDGDLIEHLGDVPSHRLVEIEDRLAFVLSLSGEE